MKVMKKRPEFQQKAMDLYDVKMKDGDDRTPEIVLREAYLDFYSKSLQPSDDPKKGPMIPYSKRMQIE